MARLTLFAKGNVDIHDSLHSCIIGGRLVWNGINEIVRERFPGTAVRVRHETFLRSDALLAATGTVPPELAGRNLPLGSYSAKSQFSTALFEGSSDAIVLSIMSDVLITLMRHRRDGYFFTPYQIATWAPEDAAWAREMFVPLELLDFNTSMSAMEQIIHRIRERTQVPILIYNVSAVCPGETIHCYQGLDETFATRVRRFNLGLTELSRQTGISIIDVDAIVARAGADRVKLDHNHLTGEGYRLIAEEVVRVLEDYGCFGEAF